MKLERKIDVDGQLLIVKKIVNRKGKLCLEFSTTFNSESVRMEADFESNEERDKTFVEMDELEAGSILQVLKIQHKAKKEERSKNG